MTRIGPHIDETAGRITPADEDWLTTQALADGPPPIEFDPFDRPLPTVDNDGRPRTANTPEVSW